MPYRLLYPRAMADVKSKRAWRNSVWFKYIGVPVEEIGYNQPAEVRYPTENPWK